MRLTSYTDYALRTLMYCGLRRDGLATISEIAEAYGISRNHVVKIVHDLGRLGLLDTRRGKGGGIRLGRPPEEIRLGRLVALLEGARPLVECFDPHACHCPIVGVCRLQDVLAEAQQAFYDALDRYTLADLLESAVGLRERLGLSAAV